MAGFTKLFATIITSSIWSEDDKTRIMWITMLASINDPSGHIDGSVPGMAAISRMSIEDAEKAIAKLESPDPYSRTPDEDGRRIVREPGGWRVVNATKYRDARDSEKRREQNRESQQRWRERKQNVSQRKQDIIRNNQTSAHADAEAEADKEKNPPLSPQGGKPPDKKEFGEFVRLKPEEHKALVERFGEHGAAERIENLDHYIGSKGKNYKSHYHTILTWERNDGKRRQDRTYTDRGSDFGDTVVV